MACFPIFLLLFSNLGNHGWGIASLAQISVLLQGSALQGVEGGRGETDWWLLTRLTALLAVLRECSCGLFSCCQWILGV